MPFLWTLCKESSRERDGTVSKKKHRGYKIIQCLYSVHFMSFMTLYLQVSETMTGCIWPNVFYKLYSCHKHYYSIAPPSWMRPEPFSEAKWMSRMSVSHAVSNLWAVLSHKCERSCVLHLADFCRDMITLWGRPSPKVLADSNTFQRAFIASNSFLSRCDIQIKFSL